MKLKEIYNLAIEMGKKHDPRGIEEVEKRLAKTKERYEKLNEEEKQEFDTDKLFNPFSDTRVLLGDLDQEIKHILVGIDMEVGEVVLADRLTAKGQQVDLILSHHPEGKAMSALHGVMDIQEDVLAKFGVPINVAESIMAPRISEVRRSLLPQNHNRAVDAAKLLGFAFMCMHTPADNMVNDYLQTKFDQQQPETLDDIIKMLKQEPEYAEAVKYNAGPTIVVGNKDRRPGKIMVDMTGGTGGSQDAYNKLQTAGVGTLVTMHIGEKHRKEAEKNHINVIIAGHMASDSLGMNLILDKIEQQGIEVVTTSGLLRYKR
jgi:putative NIF3 family GTP cyclohydrolase 1 type 2